MEWFVTSKVKIWHSLKDNMEPPPFQLITCRGVGCNVADEGWKLDIKRPGITNWIYECGALPIWQGRNLGLHRRWRAVLVLGPNSWQGKFGILLCLGTALTVVCVYALNGNSVYPPFESLDVVSEATSDLGGCSSPSGLQPSAGLWHPLAVTEKTGGGD